MGAGGAVYHYSKRLGLNNQNILVCFPVSGLFLCCTNRRSD
ncbi:hypothetical protein ACV566_06230 [Staphylococcus aureus]